MQLPGTARTDMGACTQPWRSCPRTCRCPEAQAFLSRRRFISSLHHSTKTVRLAITSTKNQSTDRGGLAPALARCELLARTYLPLRQVLPQRTPHPQTAPYFSPQSSSIRKQTKKATPGHSNATMNAIPGYVLSGCGALVPAPLLFVCLGPTHVFCLWIL